MEIYYITKGSVRGSCGHRQRTIETACECQHRDEVGCRKQGGYSDRSIRIIEGGEERLMTEGEHAKAFTILDALNNP